MSSKASLKEGGGKIKGRKKRRKAFELAYPNCAGIDVGSASHYVSVPEDRDEHPVREFKSFTRDLRCLADWLVKCGIDTVVMESTGVYWIPVYEYLESRGFKVFLVNARHVKNVSGRKSDVLDCQWLRQLMSYGLLSGAFRPSAEICALRAVMRQRSMLIRDQARQVQHMQKALTQMNLQLGNVITDIVGETGQRIIRAIVAGERDGRRLAAFRDVRIKANEEAIAAALEGTWREEHLFALRQAVALFDTYGALILECDRKLEAMLARLGTHAGDPGPSKRRGRAKNAPSFDVRTALYRLCGVDLTRVDGIDATTALKVLSELGPDIGGRFKTVKHFTSWLNICPDTKISGGKRLSGASKRAANRVAQALRMAAMSLYRSQSALGAQFRRLCRRLDKGKAIKAMAHKLARLIYALLTKGTAYVDRGLAYEEERYRQRTLHHLKRRASALGFTLTPTAAEPAHASPA